MVLSMTLRTTVWLVVAVIAVANVKASNATPFLSDQLSKDDNGFATLLESQSAERATPGREGMDFINNMWSLDPNVVPKATPIYVGPTLAKPNVNVIASQLSIFPPLKALGVKIPPPAPPVGAGCPGGKLPALITAVRLVTGACTDRSFGTLCLPGDCRVQLDVLVDAFEKCVNSLPDDISKTIAKDWFDIEAATCSSPPDARARSAIQFLGNDEQPPLRASDREPSQPKPTPNGQNGVAEPFNSGQPNLTAQDMVGMQRLSIRSPGGAAADATAAPAAAANGPSVNPFMNFSPNPLQGPGFMPQQQGTGR